MNETEQLEEVKMDGDNTDISDNEEVEVVTDDNLDMEYDLDRPDDGESVFGDDDDDDDDELELEQLKKEGEESNEIFSDDTSYYDSDEDTEEFDKLNERMTVELLSEHPEFTTHNIKEVNALSKVIKDSNGNIIDKFHKTIPFITRYERAKILGERTKQLTYSNVDSMVNVPPHIIDSYQIAIMEYNANVIPYIVKRNLPGGTCEYWKFSDLEKILFE